MYQIKDNLLKPELFKQIQEVFFSQNFMWYMQDKMTDNDSFVFNHQFFKYHLIRSPFYESFIVPILETIQCKGLNEARANMMVKKENRYESGYHVDRPFKCVTCIFYINTNNGYTVLKTDKEIKVNCKENRLLLFDSTIQHKAVSQTDTNQRIVINLNLFI